MAKKDFKKNPALQFLSEPEPLSMAAQLEAAPISTEVAELSPLEAPPAKTSTPPPGYKVNPMFVEVRSKRVQIVLQPSLYEKLRAETQRRGISINGYIHGLLEAALGEEV